MNLQKINVKLFVDSPDPVPVDALLPIFARWRENRSHPSQWVDMADYAHVPDGPGVMIIGHQGNLGLDLGAPGPGILYANKKDLDGGNEDRILDTFRRALALTEALGNEPEFPSGVKVRPGSWQVTFNDRLVTPNTGETESALRPALDAAFDKLFGAGQYTAIRENDPLRRYGYVVQSDGVEGLDTIAARL